MPRRDYYLPSRQLVNQDDAAITERANVPRSRFTGSWNRLTTFDAGKIIPIMVEEVLPGDHLTYDVTAYIRMQTPLFPIFSNQRVDTHFFFVPCRLVWENWEKFMGAQDSPSDGTNFVIPRTHPTAASLTVGGLFDYFGIPIGMLTGSNYAISALPFRAYMLIWNTWYRDQNITNGVTVATGNGPDDPIALDYNSVAPRAKFHDYFTSALPWPQKVSHAIAMPLSGRAPISGLGSASGSTANSGTTAVLQTANPVSTNYSSWYQQSVSPTGQWLMRTATSGLNAAPDVWAELGEAVGVTINAFRQAYMLQQLLERDARGGTRYIELLRAHFGVLSPDFRLQRPEYIGGGSTPFNVTPVAQTAPAAGTTVGALGAAGTATGQHRASYAATEHGYILGLMSVRTELAYQQGIHKMWLRESRFDFYWPSLAQLGEQAIIRQEIYAVDGMNSTVFGYQERWHEYRQRHSEVTGYFRSTVAGTIDQWHLAQRFATPPTLSTAFILDRPPMARVLAAGETAEHQQYLADILFRRTAVRPLPTFGTPATLGRF